MNILYIVSVISVPHCGGEGSGGSTHAYEVARHLAARGHRVVVACRRAPGQAREERLNNVVLHRIFEPGGRVQRIFQAHAWLWKLARIPYYALRSAAHTLRLLQLARNEGIEIIYERSAASTVAGTLAAALLRLPLALEVNDFSVLTCSLRACQAVVTPDRSGIPAFAREKVLPLEWGVNTEFFHPRAPDGWVRQQFKLGATITAIFVGSGLAWHGLDDIVDAATLLQRRGQPMVFLVVGGGACIEEQQKRVRRLGLSAAFRFTGAVPYESVPALMAAADIALAPYNRLLARAGRERMASPIKLFEYMSAGKAVVTTPVGNRRRLVAHGISGWVVAENSPPALAEALEHLAADSGLRQRLGENARRAALEKYSWAAHCRQLESLFLALVLRRRKIGKREAAQNAAYPHRAT